MNWYSNNQNKLLDAAYNGNLREIQRLVDKKGVAIASCRDVIGSTPLHFACSQGHLDVVKYFIEQNKIRRDIKNNKGQTPLDLARESNHESIIMYLRSGAPSGGGSYSSQQSKGSTSSNRSVPVRHVKAPPLSETQSRSDRTSPRSNAKRNDETALREASATGNLAHVMQLLNKGVPINCQDSALGSTPLHLACAEGRLTIVKLLITRRADLGIKNKMGHTPLDVARMRNRTEVVDFLTASASFYLQQNLQMPDMQFPSYPPYDHGAAAAYGPNGMAAAAAAPVAAMPPPAAAAAVATPVAHSPPMVSAYIVGENPLPDNLSYKDQGRELRDVLQHNGTRSSASAAVAQPVQSATATNNNSMPVVHEGQHGQVVNSNSAHSISASSASAGPTIADRIERCESQLRIKPDNGASAVQRIVALEKSLFGETQGGAIRKRLERLEEELLD